jgi:hypothetical protein
MEYHLVKQEFVSNFDDTCNSMYQYGWFPAGQVFVVKDFNHNLFYCQQWERSLDDKK